MMIIKIKLVIITKINITIKNKKFSKKITTMIIIITKTENNSIKKTIKNTIINMKDLSKDKEIILTSKTTISIKFKKKQNMIKSICDVNKNYSG